MFSEGTAADGLSRRPRALSDEAEEGEGELDDYVDSELSCVRRAPVQLQEQIEEEFR